MMMNFPQGAMPPMMPAMPLPPKELKILLISDSHVHGPNLNNFAMWLKNYKPNYDVVLVAGNMANLTNKKRKDMMSETEAAEQLSQTLLFLMEHIQKPVIYIPGNTEPSMTYTYELEIPGAVNAHKRAVQLDEGLVLVGLGGAIPVQKDGKDVLEGFPYQKDEEFAKDLNMCLESAKKTFGPESDYVLLTHMGPTESPMSEAYIAKDKLQVGSKSLAEALKKSGVICHIHGHSVSNEGLARPFGTELPIINPGGLVSGRFGELTLVRGLSGKWKMGSVQFFNLEALM